MRGSPHRHDAALGVLACLVLLPIVTGCAKPTLQVRSLTLSVLGNPGVDTERQPRATVQVALLPVRSFVTACGNKEGIDDSTLANAWFGRGGLEKPRIEAYFEWEQEILVREDAVEASMSAADLERLASVLEGAASGESEVDAPSPQAMRLFVFSDWNGDLDKQHWTAVPVDRASWQNKAWWNVPVNAMRSVERALRFSVSPDQVTMPDYLRARQDDPMLQPLFDRGGDA